MGHTSSERLGTGGKMVLAQTLFWHFVSESSETTEVRRKVELKGK